MKRPYTEKTLTESITIRGFSSDVNPGKLEWPRDKENRTIVVMEGTGWRFQRDNSLPRKIEEGDVINVRAGEYHRLLKGENDLIVTIIKEKKKADGNRSVKYKADNNNAVTKMDFLPAKVLKKIAKEKGHIDEAEGGKIVCPNCGHHNDANVKKCSNCGYPRNKGNWPSVTEEGRKKKRYRRKATPGESEYRAEKYSAPKGSKRAKGMERAAAAYRRGDIELAAKIRRNQEKKHMDEEMMNDMIEEIKLDEVLSELESRLDEKKKRKKRKKSKSAGGLSAKVKKSLDKKADRRCLTRGSVYAEFRKGLAAFLSSGSRKGMSSHQWAHARVNSANPSKSWAVVKKRKKCPKKK